MKKTIIIFFLFFCLSSYSQNFSVKWSDKFKVTSGIFTNNVYITSLNTPGNSIISLFRKIKSSGFNNDYILVKLNDKLEVKGQLELNYPSGEKEGLVDVVKLKDNFFVIKYRYIDKETAEVVVNRLNTETLKIDPAEKKVVTIDAPPRGARAFTIGVGAMYNFDMDIKYSADSSHILLVFEPDQRRKEAKNVQLAVIDQRLDKVYNISYEWSEAAIKVLINNLSVDNSGNAYLGYNIYEKSFNKDFMKSDGDKIPSYSTYMMVFGNDKSRVSYSFNSADKFIHNPSLGYNEKREPILIGLYKDKYNGRLTGVFKSEAITKTNKVISNLRFTPFTQELLDAIDNDGQGKSKGNKPGLDNDFHNGYVVSVSDGVNHMICEFFEIWTTGNGEYHKFIKGDFVITTFLPDGNIVFQRLPRHQQTANTTSSTNITVANSYTPTYFEDNLLLFYNDDEDNIARNIAEKPEKFESEKKSALTVALLTHEGKLVKRKIVYNHSSIDGYVTNLRFSELAENSYVVFAFKPGNFKHGMMAGVLTIK